VTFAVPKKDAQKTDAEPSSPTNAKKETKPARKS
jgi:hypothetical protein